MNHSKKYMSVSYRVITAVVFSLVLLAHPLFSAQGADRVGVVDSGKILRQMPETKQAEATLQAATIPLQKELARMNLDMKNAIASYEQQKGSLAMAARTEKEKELRTKAQAIQKYRQTNNGVLEKKKKALFQPIRQKILAAVQSIAEKNGFSVVIEKSTALYFSADHDLTLQVMTQLHVK